MYYSLTSLKGGLYEGLYRGLLGLSRGILGVQTITHTTGLRVPVMVVALV